MISDFYTGSYPPKNNDIYWNNEQKDAGYFTVNAPDVKVFTGFVRDREFVFDHANTAAQLPQRGEISITPGDSRGTTAPTILNSPNGAIQSRDSYAPLGLEGVEERSPRLSPGVIDIASLQDDSQKEDSLHSQIIMKPGKTSLDFATISLLSLEGGGGLSDAARKSDGGYLLAATGTMHNTNGEPRRREPANQWQPNDMVTLANRWGDAPVLVEGVPLELTLPLGTWLVYPLDEAGNRRAEPPLRFENEPIRVGPELKTLWYEIRAL